MIIHLVSDEKFINQTVKTFEEHYPGENLFFVDTSLLPVGKKLKYVEQNENNVFRLDFLSESAPAFILQKSGQKIRQVIVHSLSSTKARIALDLKKVVSFKTYWICNGADLYGWLLVKGKYELFDENRLKRNFISFGGYVFRHLLYSTKLRRNAFGISEQFVSELDYFCTWNHYDYLLFKKNFKSNAKLKSFRYSALAASDFPEDLEHEKKVNIIANQSASKSGNHLTILKKIRLVDKDKSIKKLFVPLSYGAQNIKSEVKEFGDRELNYCFTPLEDFVTKSEYFEMLSTIKCGFFGHRRQEAANNILILLGYGAKVFLRRDNNLLNYFKEKGFHIYEFESDFNTVEDLTYIGIDKHRENRMLLINEFSLENMKKEYQMLIE